MACLAEYPAAGLLEVQVLLLTMMMMIPSWIITALLTSNIYIPDVL
jgi:hypothetical protein